MISKNDCILLLTDLQENGIEVKEQLSNLIKTNDIITCLDFINKNRQLDLTSFYEALRKNYNNKKSKLYINIVKEIDGSDEVLTTLAALQLQILLFSKSVTNKQMFLRHSRFEDISKVLLNYYNTYDLTICIKLLRLIKADLKACESFKVDNNVYNK